MSVRREPVPLKRLVWAFALLLPALALLVPSRAVAAVLLAVCCAANLALWRANDRERAHTASALRRMEVQYDVTEALAAAPSLDDAVPKLLRLIGRRLDFSTGLLWTPDADGVHLRPTRTWVADQSFEPTMRRFRETVAYRRGQGVSGRAWATGAPAIAGEGDLATTDAVRAAAHAMGLRGAIALPIRHGGRVLGVLAFTRTSVRPPEAEMVELLESLTRQLAMFMDRLARVQEAAAFQDAALRDALTGLLNRRAWEERLPSLVAHAGRHAEPLCFAVIDLDRFKAYNDAHGHQAGDALLRLAAASWRSAVRTEDVLARYGGEEFVLAMPGCGPAEAEELVERLRQRLPAAVTCSIGLAEWAPHETAAEAIGRADRALYAAKEAGRDRIFFARPPAQAGARSSALKDAKPTRGNGDAAPALSSAHV